MERQNNIQKEDVGKVVRVKHASISEGKLVQIHYGMSDVAVLFDLEKPDGTVRRISHETILDTKTVE
jgi:hypothetical protein